MMLARFIDHMTALARAGLLVYQKPLYQVLALEQPETLPMAAPRSGQTRSLKEVLAQALAQGGQP